MNERNSRRLTLLVVDQRLSINNKNEINSENWDQDHQQEPSQIQKMSFWNAGQISRTLRIFPSIHFGRPRPRQSQWEVSMRRSRRWWRIRIFLDLKGGSSVESQPWWTDTWTGRISREFSRSRDFTTVCSPSRLRLTFGPPARSLAQTLFRRICWIRNDTRHQAQVSGNILSLDFPETSTLELFSVKLSWDDSGDILLTQTFPTKTDLEDKLPLHTSLFTRRCQFCTTFRATVRNKWDHWRRFQSSSREQFERGC